MNELEAMTNEELRAFAEQAEGDLYQAATFEKDSDWHGSCFAALYMACMEMSSRGMKPLKAGVMQ
jgi:hypothetical protein